MTYAVKMEVVRHLYPDFRINHIEPYTHGQNNDVFLVNQSVVFRFPKYTDGMKQLQTETELLVAVGPYITLPIPNPIYQSFKENEVGKAFMGYHCIPGSPLWKEDLLGIENDEILSGIASQLVTFLQELHNIPQEAIPSFYKQNQTPIRPYFEGLYQNIKLKLYPWMRPEARQTVSNQFEHFLDGAAHLHAERTLIHGDFGTSNILWDKDAGRITGILDFGGSEIGDPAYDFAGLLSGYGETFLRRCLEMYQAGDGEDMLERIYFYKSTFALQEALHGLEHNDKQAFEDGIRAYR
ncbi:phosphotransferase family protein [Paenibacillus sp. DMB20]|uniref:phosphotransferase family protein n=1 Tax=Paenibacillus sp. DMB20 TaxID=1642570 RepID=UPI000ACE45DB|nr:aminoglycoside phosphotransferase family protein [Paenibacillus sp. DMB20]